MSVVFSGKLPGKSFILTGLVLFLVMSGCSRNPQIPKIELSAHSFDFGDIHPANGKRTTTFLIKNAGGALLTIESVSTSCGCTRANIDSNELGPGEYATLTVIYDPSVHPGLVGKIKRIVYIQSNDPIQEEVELELIGNVQSSARGGNS